MIKNVHHIQITIPVGREADAKEFYCIQLGLKEIPKPEILRKNGAERALTLR